MPPQVTTAAATSAAAGSWVSTSSAATSIGPSTKTSSNSEVSAAIAAGRRPCRPLPTSVDSVQARRIAAVSGGYVAPASADATKIQRQRGLATTADHQQADQGERVQHGGHQQHRRRADPVRERGPATGLIAAPARA